jgi:hypothetical protein
VKRVFLATEVFWKKFYALSPSQKGLVRSAWLKFRLNPFDPALGTHKIRTLSAKVGFPVYSVVLEKDLRALFYIEAERVVTFEIGTHEVYR